LELVTEPKLSSEMPRVAPRGAWPADDAGNMDVVHTSQPQTLSHGMAHCLGQGARVVVEGASAGVGATVSAGFACCFGTEEGACGMSLSSEESCERGRFMKYLCCPDSCCCGPCALETGAIESKCLPGFWADNGIPDLPVPCIGPLLAWFFAPDNKYLNDSACARYFGSIGSPWADRHRKHLYGIGIGLTLLCMVITGFGCFALSDDPDVIMHTSWGYAFYRAPLNQTDIGLSSEATGAYHGVDIYLGLVGFVVRECKQARSEKISLNTQWEECEVHPASGLWADVRCDENKGILGFSCSEVEQCQDEAVGNQLNAFSTCVTLILAMLGVTTRIKKKADSNIQKLLGEFFKITNCC